MSENTLSLDDIRAAVERKYAALDLEVDGTPVRLLNPLRLPKEKRAKLEEAQASMKEPGADQAEVLKMIFRIVAESKPAVEKLLKACGDDVAILAELFSTYGKRCQPGEASA